MLHAGSWYKMGIPARGVYRISYDQFRKMGFAGSIDPRNIRVYGNAGGMLPQPNAAARPEDLTESAIFIQGEDDGVFNSGDYILFYAEGPALERFDALRRIARYESNLYSNRNYYFITVGDTPGKRLGEAENLSGSYPVVNRFDDYAYHEVDQHNELESGREWFGETFYTASEQVVTVEMPGVIEGAPLQLVSDVMARSTSSTSFKVYVNNTLLGEQVIPGLPDSQYAMKGVHNRDTLQSVGTVPVGGRTTHEVKFQYVKTGSGTGYLDFFLLNVQRALAMYKDQVIFRSTASIAQPASTFTIEGAGAQTTVWDITDPSTPALQTTAASFSTTTTTLKEFIVFRPTAPAPEFIGSVDNQDLHGMATPNLIIVAYPDFSGAAQRLAAHRESHSHWTVQIVTPQEIYNEFSSGRQDITAIRDFVKYIYDKSPGTLRSLLLMGRASYDYKDRMLNNTNFVPAYESRNSLEPLATYSSDDYYGFLESNEGEWSEEVVQSHTLDIGVGRLPVKTIAEANTVVDKIIYYDTNKKSYGRWRKQIMFVADDGNNDDRFTRDHQFQANTMAESIESLHPEFDTRKIFMGAYHKTVRPNGEVIPEVSEDIVRAFDRGTLIINYTGHGSEQVWADERVFTDAEINDLQNKLYPFVVTATCEFGRNDDPAVVSSAEQTLLHPQGGSIGLVTTARPVYSATNFDLNRAFYEALFEKQDNYYKPLGEVYRDTKNNSGNAIGNRNFSLLGDPSLTLAMPYQEAVVTTLQTSTGSDTLKALSTVEVTGEVRDASGNRLDNFTGILEATLFDKPTAYVTVGKNNPPFSFSQRDNALFRGKAKVDHGTFTFSFILPKNLRYEIGPGKLSLYASDPEHMLDAAGSTDDFQVGGSEPNVAPDNTPPQITLYMGDTTFVSGGIVNPSTTLVARLEDASGINISNYGIGNNLVAIVDDGTAYAVSDYYEADVNDFTRGWLNFPLHNLTPGRHTLTLKAWDTYNNPAQAQINFVVTDGEALVIETFSNYPNPFRDGTTLFFTHNRVGDDLEGELVVYDVTGLELKRATFTVFESSYRVELPRLTTSVDLDKNVSGGLYLARVAVRSLTNGSKNERVTKLITVK
ncbi:type IX secretion system sortase PorU [Parachryseolinea silvisoli]|uniref:type IX secretion system sortase PorU n=1 Tax=Parachryseolinea silvisoli TaxID=2873601 RepID=UPI002265AD0F|nr:type IX secretion system sortase PorU [Parachryseolinea silvisoli]MCD9016978.1 type IX secretion system sortase PorU [Parachryseolinea silvisoli]